MRKSKTHFEQIPVEEVKKIAEEEVGKQKQRWIDDITVPRPTIHCSSTESTEQLLRRVRQALDNSWSALADVRTWLDGFSGRQQDRDDNRISRARSPIHEGKSDLDKVRIFMENIEKRSLGNLPHEQRVFLKADQTAALGERPC